MFIKNTIGRVAVSKIDEHRASKSPHRQRPARFRPGRALLNADRAVASAQLRNSTSQDRWLPVVTMAIAMSRPSGSLRVAWRGARARLAGRAPIISTAGVSTHPGAPLVERGARPIGYVAEVVAPCPSGEGNWKSE
jgi:hypothetical protein